MRSALSKIKPAYAFRKQSEEDNDPTLTEELVGKQVPVFYLVDANEINILKSIGGNVICRGVRIWKFPDDLPEGVSPYPRAALFEFDREKLGLAFPDEPFEQYARAYLFESRRCWKVQGSVENHHHELPRFKVEFKDLDKSVDKVTWLGISYWAEWNRKDLQMGERMAYLARLDQDLADLIDVNHDSFARRFQRIGLTRDL